MPLIATPHATHVTARLLDFLGDNTPWQRRLWTVGLVLSIEEVLEASAAAADGVLDSAAIPDLRRTVVKWAGQDRALTREERSKLHEHLRDVVVPDGLSYHALAELQARFDEDYLLRWSRALAETDDPPQAERAARAMGGHLLDKGFSGTFLHRWLTYQVKHRPDPVTLADIVEEADRLVRAGPEGLRGARALRARRRRTLHGRLAVCRANRDLAGKPWRAGAHPASGRSAAAAERP